MDNVSPAEPPLAAIRPGEPAVTRFGLIAFAVAALTVALDQLSKAWILYGLRLPERITMPILPVFSLTMVWNRGVSFGLLRAETMTGRLALAAFAVIVVAILAFWARRAGRWTIALGLGLVMGGALGNNLIDRLRFGAVVDFLDFSGLGFFPWVFNVADSAITVGVALLLLDSFLTGDKAAAKTPARP